ncbi:hypothetical protein MRX96_002888 [Rhipicephalus microplus]
MLATVVSTSGARMVTLETPEGPQRCHVDQLWPRLDLGSSPNKQSQVNEEAQCSPKQADARQDTGVLPLSHELKNLIRGMLEPVPTLRSSMARVLRHPWVHMSSVLE